jgi:outer membrane immunogenic protein
MKYNALWLSPLGLIPAGLLPADAADLPVKAPRATTFTPFTPSWTGLYGGLNVGVISARSSLGAFLPSSATAADQNYCWLDDCNFNASPNATGVLGGLQIGYNFQSANFVYGVELDYGLSSAKKSSSGTHPTSGYSYAADTGIKSMATARLRLGYAFSNNMMIYATGGLALADVRDSFLHIESPPVVATYSWSDTKWRAGYAVGGGLEYMFARNWSVKGEGLYYDLGTKNHESLSPALGGISVGLTDKMSGVIGRIGLNYLFH